MAGSLCCGLMKSEIMKKLLIFSLACLLGMAGFGQEARITGVVTDGKTSETLIGVNIVVKEGLGTATDIDGNYNITVEPGTYRVTYKFVGYQDVEREVTLTDGETREVNVTMTEDAKKLGIVTVTGSKYEKNIGEETVSIEVLTPEFISNSNTTSIDEALDKVPGVNMIGEQVNIRGGAGYSAGAGSRVLMMMDGLPLLKPDNGTIDFGSLPMENIQQIEVIKGASSALYGSGALNGMINLITAWPKNEPYTKMTAYYGVYENPFSGDRKKYIWWDRNPMFGGFNFGHRKRYKNIDLVIGSNYYEDESYLYGASIRRINANIKFRYRSPKNPGLSMGLTANMSSQSGGFFFFWKGWGDSRTDTTGTGGFTDERFDEYIEDYVRQNEFVIPDSLRKNVPGDAQAYLPSEYGEFRSIPVSFDPFLTYFDKKGHMHAFKGRWYITYYNNSSGEESNSNLAYGEYTFHSELKALGLNFVTGAASTYTYITSETFGKKAAVNAAGFLQVDKKFFDRLTFNFGIRAEYNRLDTLDGVLKPIVRTGFNLQLFEATYLRGSFGQGYRYPTVAEKFVDTRRSGVQVIPNPDLEAESGWSAELGIKQALKLTEDWVGYVDVSGFVTQYKNMVEFNLIEGGGFVTQAMNVDNARISGFEVSVLGQGKIGNVNINMLVGYTYLVPIDLNAADSLSLEERMLNFRFQHSGKADVEATYKNVTIGITGTYVSYMHNIGRFGTVNGISKYRNENENPEFVFDARIGYNLTEETKVSFIAKNLLNNQYTLRPAYFEPPRNYTLQVAYMF